MKTTKERFWEKVDLFHGITDEDCWNWIAGKNSRGYGGFDYLRKKSRANRVVWILYKGEIPDGLLVCHKCDNPSCVNPSHLFLGTCRDNAVDSVNKKRNFEIKKTHCPRGHPYSGDNLYSNPNRNDRRCKTCRKMKLLQAKLDRQVVLQKP